MASSSSTAVPMSWVTAVIPSTSPPICRRTGVASLARIFTRRMASNKASRDTVSVFGWLGGISWR